MNSEQLRTTQQSSNFVDYSPRKKKINIGYAGMFIDDFCFNFSISLKESWNNHKFYYIESDDTKLEELLEYDNYDFLRHDFDEILMQNMHDLILHGVAYVELVRSYDSDNELKQISFVPISYRKQFNLFGNIYYKLRKFDGTDITGVVQRENIIVFRLKDMKLKKKYFSRVIKKLSRLEFPDVNLTLDKNSGFDWDVYKQWQEKELLKVSRKTYWNGRNYENPYISEPYLLFRNMKFDLLRKEFLDYLVNVYNVALQQLGQKYQFSGMIKYDTKVNEYERLIQELSTGEKNCKQVSDCIFKL